MIKTQMLTSCLAVAALLAATPLHAAPVLSLLPHSTALQPGATLDVGLQVSGLDTSVPRTLLGAFDFSVQYDAATLTPLAMAFDAGSGLGGASDPSQTLYVSDSSVAGVLRLIGLSLLEASATDCVFCNGLFLSDLQSDTFLLGTMHFQVLGDAMPGTSMLLLPATDAVVSDGGGSPVSISGSANAFFTVPEPAGLPVVVSVLLAAWLAGRGWGFRKVAPALAPAS